MLFILLAIPVQAAGQGAGVSPGQWVRYSIVGDLSEGVVKSNLTIAFVSGTNVTVNSQDIYGDRNVTSQTLWIDLSTGQNNTRKFGVGGFFFAILPRIGIGDSIYGGSAYRVQNRMARTYAQATRDVNFLNVTDISGGSTSYYWDVASGILAETLRTYVNSTTNQLRVGVDALMTETNMWGPSGETASFYLPLLALGGIGFLALVLVYLRFRRSNKR